MQLTTFNSFGKISISKLAVCEVAAVSALECVGVYSLVSKPYIATKNGLVNAHKGVAVTSLMNDIMKIDVFIVMRHCGVSASAVADSVRHSVKYSVERFAGMIVKDVVVHIMDVRI